MTESILSARALSYKYPGSVNLCQRCGGHREAAIDNLTLELPKRKRIALLGANGSGKSTLMRIISGNLRPSGGSVAIDGQPVDYSHTGLSAWRQRVGLVFQNPDDQIFAATVYQDITFGPLNLGLPEEEVRRRTDEALLQMGIGDLADSPIHMLSGGQRKLVAIAGVVAMRPTVLLLDEPTAGVDAAGEAQLLAVLSALQTQGITVMLASHDTNLALSWAEEVLVLRHGSLLQQGSPVDILSDDEVLAQAHLRMPFPLEGWRLVHRFRREGADLPRPTTTLDLIKSIYIQCDAESGRRGLFSPGSHSTPHAGPHGALPPDWKGSP